MVKYCGHILHEIRNMRRAGISKLCKAPNGIFLDDGSFIGETVPALPEQFIDRSISHSGNAAEKLPDRLPGGSDPLENRCVGGVAAHFQAAVCRL